MQSSESTSFVKLRGPGSPTYDRFWETAREPRTAEMGKPVIHRLRDRMTAIQPTESKAPGPQLAPNGTRHTAYYANPTDVRSTPHSIIETGVVKRKSRQGNLEVLSWRLLNLEYHRLDCIGTKPLLERPDRTRHALANATPVRLKLVAHAAGRAQRMRGCALTHGVDDSFAPLSDFRTPFGTFC